MLDWRNSRSKPDAGAVAAVLLMGAVVGAAAGLLLAPQSGEQTRARLKQKAKGSVDKTVSKTNEVRNAAEANFNQAAEVARRTVAEAKRATREVKGHPSLADDEAAGPA